MDMMWVGYIWGVVVGAFAYWLRDTARKGQRTDFTGRD